MLANNVRRPNGWSDAATQGTPVTQEQAEQADYQLINHPAYDRERGPVSIFGLRLHLQF